MTLKDDYRAYLMAEVAKAQDGFIHHSNSPDGEWNSKKLANQYLREVKRLSALLQKEFDQPEEFEWEATLWQKRNSYPLH